MQEEINVSEDNNIVKYFKAIIMIWAFILILLVVVTLFEGSNFHQEYATVND